MKRLANKSTPIFRLDHKQRGLDHDKSGVPNQNRMRAMTREQILHYLKVFRSDITKEDIIGLILKDTDNACR
jgi:hypothetical protein